MRTLDVSRFHPDCPNKYVIGTGDGPFIVCPTCGIVAHCVDVGVRISPADGYKVGKAERLAIAQPSKGVPGPGNIEKVMVETNKLI